jgi:NADPH:quinone reductase-like Zn-dependent oxidoreductase
MRQVKYGGFMRAIQITEFGGPEVLREADIPRPEPGPADVLIEVSRAGINFADTHNRANTYLAPAPTPASGSSRSPAPVDTPSMRWRRPR